MNPFRDQNRMPKTNTEKQATYWEKQRNKGMKRILLWVPEEDVDRVKTVAKSPQALINAEKKIIAELIEKIEKSDRIKRDVERKLFAKTYHAFVSQARLHMDRQIRKENAPPARITFETYPPRFVRALLKEAFFYYDPVSQCWLRPINPKHWDKAVMTLNELKEQDVSYVPLKLDPHHKLEDLFRDTQKRVSANYHASQNPRKKKNRRNVRRR